MFTQTKALALALYIYNLHNYIYMYVYICMYIYIYALQTLFGLPDASTAYHIVGFEAIIKEDTRQYLNPKP